MNGAVGHMDQPVAFRIDNAPAGVLQPRIDAE